MRDLFGVLFASLALVVMNAGAARADSVEVKGPHICCTQCVKVVGKLLSKVDGVSEAKCDIKSKTITFTAKDENAAKAGFKALLDGGFFGSATCEGKELKADVLALPKDNKKADVVVIKGVHVCCEQCESGIGKIIKDGTITYEGKGPQRTVRIEGSGLAPGAVLQALRKGGFNGTLEK